MCGIWAYIINNRDEKIKFNNGYYERYHKILKTRGNDDYNYIVDDKFILCFYRLSINDVSLAGRQPFIFSDERDMGSYTYYVVCNGEIYNYKELKSEYKIETYSNSDCEIIYHLFVKMNYNIKLLCMKLLGEFAFIIIRKNNRDPDNVLYWIGRDPYGVRSLYYGYTHDGIIVSTLCKCLLTLTTNIRAIKPGYYYTNNKILKNYDTPTCYYVPKKYTIDDNIYYNITDKLIRAVNRRLLSDRPIGALLSGGLDSSLIIAILCKVLKLNRLTTFSIGLTEDSPDIISSRKVIEHLRKTTDTIIDHKEVIVSVDDALKVIEDVIKTIETYDITTIRASIMQYLIAEYISKNTYIKVIFNGDGADEVQLGYLYYKYALDSIETELENQELLNEISNYDVLRVDKCISNFALEARVPYLDIEFVDYYLSIPLRMKLPRLCDNIEKRLIREAFNKIYPDILPKDILYRTKEAFSDGVSVINKSWFTILQEHIDTLITDEEYKDEKKKYNINEPKTKEGYYYRKIFDKYFNTSKLNIDTIVPHYWLPKWIDTDEPSARILSVYE